MAIWSQDHDRWENTYTFTKDGRQVIFVHAKEPLWPSSALASSSDIPKTVKAKAKTSSVSLSHNLFKDEIQSSQCVIFLEAKEVGDGLSVPHEIVSLLKEYKKIIHDELPDGLPPLHDIRHYIDLVSATTLPHLPHYHMSPKEYEELHRWVLDLLKNGISERVRVVPALDS